MPASATSPAPDPDEDIVHLIRDRQNIGLRTLLERHGALTQRALKRALGSALDDTEIEEAMSTASYQAWRAIDTYEPSKGTLRAWFLVIARNAGRAILRNRQRRQWEPSGDAMALMPADTTPDTTAEAQPSGRHAAFLAALHTCIAELPRLQRKVIEADLLTGDVADASHLAKELKTSKNAIYVSRSTARKGLRKKLAELGFTFDETEQS